MLCNIDVREGHILHADLDDSSPNFPSGIKQKRRRNATPKKSAVHRLTASTEERSHLVCSFLVLREKEGEEMIEVAKSSYLIS